MVLKSVSSGPLKSEFLRRVLFLFLRLDFLQEESDDDDEWDPAKAAGVCLMLLAQCTQDDIVPVTLPFITNNIQNENWRFR